MKTLISILLMTAFLITGCADVSENEHGTVTVAEPPTDTEPEADDNETTYPLQIKTLGFVVDSNTVTKTMNEAFVEITPYSDGFKIRISPTETPICDDHGCDAAYFYRTGDAVHQDSKQTELILANTQEEFDNNLEIDLTPTYNTRSMYKITGWIEVGPTDYVYEYLRYVASSHTEMIWVFSSEKLNIDPMASYTVSLDVGYKSGDPAFSFDAETLEVNL